MATISEDDVFELTEDHVAMDVGEETLMMRVETGRYFSVDQTAKAAWGLIDGERSLSDIADALTDRYDVDRAACLSDMVTFAEQLLKEGLVRHAGSDGTSPS